MRRLLYGVLVVMASMVLASSAAAEPFGLKTLEISAINENGTPDVQAGSHPYELVTNFTLSAVERYKPGEGGGGDFRLTGGGLKDVQVQLPPGFVGNPDATPKCAYQAFAEKQCPNDTVVGEVTTGLPDHSGIEVEGQLVDEVDYYTEPVYNIEAPGAVAAEFAYHPVGGAVSIFLDSSVRTGADYGVTVNVRNIPVIVPVGTSTVRIWGIPAEASHDRLRGTCLAEDESISPEDPVHNEFGSTGECPAGVPAQPLLTNPTSCGVPRTAKLSVDDWESPGNFSSEENVSSLTATLPELDGCEDLNFSPTIDVTPDGTAGSTPTGLNVELHVPQESTTNPDGKGEADVKDTTVTLPPGVQISPSASDGLEACSNAQIGFEGVNPVTGIDEFTPRKPGSVAAAEAGETAPLQPGVNFCPNASKLATVHIKTPLLEGELEGAVYLAAPQNFSTLKGFPQENPFQSLIAMYLVAEEEKTGVLVKLAGKVSLSETGQITTTFENTPELPFSTLKLEFFGADRAPLATPALCGTYTTQTAFTPWSSPETGPPQHPSSHFEITSGPNGASCSDPLPFAPSLASGSTNINAGSFSNLTTTLSREDGQQSIQQVTLHYPPGLTGSLSGVELCPEAQANAGTCGPNSQIGETIVSVGLGNDPFSVTGGKVYITEKYDGAPFGLSIVNPAKAGPFDLQEGRPVVVRAKIEVNPLTAALTVTTNTQAQGNAIPSMIEDIPLQIKHVNVLINRPGFTFNPTSCNPTKVTGAVTSAERASSPVEDAFQVTNCAQLKFEPKLAVSTKAQTSKADGASLTYKVTYPSAPQGTQSDIRYVKVELPEELPSRLTTLQKACTQTQFQANPAGCPSASVIGHAKAIVPNIPVPIEGPVYFVSNGGEAFPNLVMVLQGYGVTIDLVGDTLIKNGVTSTTFNAIPDNPLTSFEINLPEGPYSALAANGNLCKPTKTETVKKRVKVRSHGKTETVTRRLKEQVATSIELPNEYIGQNGAQYKYTAPIQVTGCPKAKPAAKHHKKAKGKRKKK